MLPPLISSPYWRTRTGSDRLDKRSVYSGQCGHRLVQSHLHTTITANITTTADNSALSRHGKSAVCEWNLGSSSTHGHLLAQPPTRTDFAGHRFRHSTPVVQRSLPATVLGSLSLTVFTAGPHCLQCNRCICYAVSVRLSVCLSHSGVLSRRMKLRSCGFHYQVAKSL